MKSLLTFIQKHQCIALFSVCALCFFTPFDYVGAADVVQKSFADRNFFFPLAKLIYGLSLMIGGLFIGLGGFTLDLTLQKLVVGMGTFFSGGFGEGVISTWGVVRDVLNIVFIYSFIYLGIKTILNSESSSTQKSLGLLIIAALFINFSLFITSVIVDFSNTAATQIYSEILEQDILPAEATVVGAVDDGRTPDDRSVRYASGSISGAFLDVVNLTSWFGGNSETINNMSTIQVIVFGLFMMMSFILAGFIFFLSAIRLIYRFIALTLYMIFSPIMFLGMILPKFASQSSKWWSGLLKNAFFAPAFLFLIYLSLKLLMKLKAGLEIGDASEYSSLFASGGDMSIDTFTIFMFFAMMIGFLYASVKVGELMSVAGAKTSIKIAGAAQGFAYRNTVGRGLNKVGVGGMDRLARAAEDGNVAAKLVHGILGGEASRKGLEKASNWGAGGKGRADVEKMNKERSQRATRGNQISEINSKIKAGTSAPKGATGDDARIAMEKAVQGASSSQITDMIKNGDLNNVTAVAGFLSESQFKAIEADKDIDDGTQKILRDARAVQVETRLKSAAKKTNLGDAIEKADVADLKALGFEKVLPHAGKLSAKQIEDWKDLTPTEKTRLKTKRKEELHVEFGVNDDGVGAGGGASALFGRIKSDVERSKLPDTILTHPASAEYLNKQVLTKIVDNDGIDEATRGIIKTRVLDHLGMVDLRTSPPGKKQAEMQKWFDENNIGQRF